MYAAKSKWFSGSIAAGFALACTGAATGQPILTYSYENLGSSFDMDSGVLSASANDDSTGSMTRRTQGQTAAQFSDLGAPNTADFMLDITVSNVGGNQADGVGSFVATDVDGDTFTGDVSGTFNFVPTGSGSQGTLFFGGSVDSASFADVSGDGTFDGQDGSFNADFSNFGNLTGAIQRLEISAANFFESDFSGGVSEVDGQFVPAPASVALLGLGGVAASRRRRR